MKNRLIEEFRSLGKLVVVAANLRKPLPIVAIMSDFSDPKRPVARLFLGERVVNEGVTDGIGWRVTSSRLTLKVLGDGSSYQIGQMMGIRDVPRGAFVVRRS